MAVLNLWLVLWGHVLGLDFKVFSKSISNCKIGLLPPEKFKECIIVVLLELSKLLKVSAAPLILQITPSSKQPILRGVAQEAI